MMSAFFSPAPLLVVVLLLLMVVAHPRGGLIIEQVSAAGYPYSSVWFPYAASRTTSAVTPPHNRRLLAEDVVVLPPRGAGRCIAANPFSGGSDCIQYSGPAWTAKPESAKKDCDEGSSVPGITGVFTPDALCPAADGTNLVGTCSLNGGVSSPNEKRLVVANNGLSSPQINMARMACTTFARGMWIPNDSDSVPSSTTTTTTGAASRIEAPPPSSSSISASSSSSSSSPAAELPPEEEGAHVLIVGVEGAGHHTICNGLLDPRPPGVARLVPFSPDIFLDGDYPETDAAKLGAKLLLARRRWGKSSGSTVYCANSFPMGDGMGKHLLTRHPDVNTFLSVPGVTTRAIFVYRNLSDATRSSMRRFRPPDANFTQELVFTRQSQDIIDESFQSSCGDALPDRCYKVVFEDMCANKVDTVETIKAATGATGPLSVLCHGGTASTLEDKTSKFLIPIF